MNKVAEKTKNFIFIVNYYRDEIKDKEENDFNLSLKSIIIFRHIVKDIKEKEKHLKNNKEESH